MRDVVVLPGGRFGPAAGMLMYAGGVAERRGATVHRHSWTVLPDTPLRPEAQEWATSQIVPVLDRLPDPPLLIGKSLGTLAASLAADRNLPAIWLTPLLDLPWVIEALARAQAPFLLVGGTADQTWNSKAAHELTTHVLEVRGADHGLYVPGTMSDSIAVLDRVLTEIDAFLTQLQRPSDSYSPLTQRAN